MADKTLTQKIVLKADEYISTVKKANQEIKSFATDANNALVSNSKMYQQNEAQIKQWGKSAGTELEKYGRTMRENFSTGMKALTLDLGRDAIKKATSDATNMAFSFSKAFAEIKSRTNASESDLNKWRKSLMRISADTTANMDSMAESFKDMFSSVKSPDELMKVMGLIGQAAAMGDGDATKVGGFVKSTLQGQGRTINASNVSDVLGASDILRRNGNGFKDMDEAMGAMGAVSGQELSKSKLSERDLAAIIAGATKTGSEKGAAIGAVKDLISASNNGLMQGSVLASVLGTNKLTDKSGKFDITKLGGAGAYQKLLNYGGGDEKKAREVFAKISGLSAESSDAVFNMVKNFKALNGAVQEAEHDQKSFAESAEQAKDNLVNAYMGFKNTLISGVTDILGGFEKPIKELFKGNLGSAVKGTGSAIGQALSGIAEHPALVAGTALTVLGGGALIGSLLKKIPMAGLATGIAKGKVLQQAGIAPVYVTNASEIGAATQSIDKTGGVMDMISGAAGGVGVGAGGTGFLAKMLGTAGLWAGGAAAAGAGGYAVGSGANWVADQFGSTNKYGQKSNIFERGMAKSIPEFMGGMSSSEYADTYGGNSKPVKIEIDVKHPGFTARPTASDNQRGGHY